MRKLIILVIVFASALLLGVPSGAWAFGLTGAGGSAGVVAPEDVGSTLDIGAHLEFEQPGSQFHLLPGIRYWQSDGLSDLTVNGDGYYHFLSQGVATPYVGAGLGLHLMHNDRSDESSTSLGPNLLGGIRFPASFGSSFVEARYAVADRSQLAVLGGLTWHLH